MFQHVCQPRLASANKMATMTGPTLQSHNHRHSRLLPVSKASSSTVSRQCQPPSKSSSKRKGRIARSLTVGRLPGQASPLAEVCKDREPTKKLGILWLEDVVKIDLECDPTRVYNLDTLVYHFLDFRLELAIIVNASGTHFGFLLGAIPLMPLRKRGDEVRPELSESDWQALTEFAEQSPHVKFARDESVDGDSLQNFVQSMGLPYISALIGDGDTIKKLETIDTEFCKELNKTITEGKMNFKDCAFMEYLLCLPRKTTQVLQPLDSDHISGVLKKKLKQFENDISEAGQQSENRLVAAFHVLISAFEELVQSTDAVKQSFDKTGNFPPSLAKMQQRCEEAGIAFPSEKKSEEEKDKITCEAWRFWNSVPASNIKDLSNILDRGGVVLAN